ncbi:Transglutaminase-like superfamily protein [Rhodobacteraceae bacterium THAF1]|uniref:transglutaminase family protein n=1 Tax=Palleronia sp. THAF1 TaxID=2587842 RepID=UPI000F3C1374|nr:transglutaminase family protein [Palleronia sp. THAF1]QFU08657.1 Transglutaminase-like superfamily protein [Palleronia sp. THAF1]VDC28403.1 Transglutaminase-like superfamily protein [Rhodobacteraceae bacterium THAF1]
MKLKITHRTSYAYDTPKRTVVQSLRLWPTEFDGQSVSSWSVTVDGHPATRGAAFRDGAGDWIETVTLRDVESMAIVVEGEVETTDLTGVLKGLREKVPPTAYLRHTEATRLNGDLRDLAMTATDGIDSDLDRAHAIATAVRENIVYTPGATEADTTAAQALELGKGVCQDQSHAVIAMARALDMPGRYAVGYLHATSDGETHQASHAWAELFIDGLGWVGFDAANGVCPDDKYVRLGSGIDAHLAAPIRGRALGGGDERLDVDVQVVEQGQQQSQSQS